jgi:Tol biopolymer transport system component
MAKERGSDWTAEQIRDELASMLASEQFKRSGRLSRFLSFVVENALQANHDRLKEYVLGLEVYQRGVDFDPRIDSTVRVEAARLRTKLREYYESAGADARIRIDLPKGGYTPAFHRIETRSANANAAVRRLSPTAIVAVACLLLSGSVVALIVKTGPAAASAPVTVSPFTSSPGVESQPAFSPDGRQIAFLWDGQDQDNVDVYVKPLSGGEPRRLTTDPARDDGPAWAPDGSHIAFFRHHPAVAGFYIVPVHGGPERLLASAYSDRLPGRFVDWFPDSTALAVVDKDKASEPFSIFRLDVDTGQERRLTWPPPDSHGDRYPSVSPDGKSLAYARTHAFPVADIFVTNFATGEVRRLTSDNQVVNGIAWTEDSRAVVFSSERGSTAGAGNLWKVEISPGAVPQQVRGPGPRASLPALARTGRLLAYQDSRADNNIWRVANPAGSSTPSMLIASSREEAWPRYSPDGQRIAFQSNRSGNWEIWVAKHDGSDPFQVTSFGGAPARFASWSPDGRRLAFDYRGDGSSDIYTIALEGRSMNRITGWASAEETPAWSSDGRWIYFASNHSGDFDVWKAAVTPDGKPNGEPVRITHGGGAWPAEGARGFVYYVKGPREKPELWKSLGTGRQESLVLRLPANGHVAWSVHETGVYFVAPRKGASEIRRFVAGRDEVVCELGGRALRRHISLSPDGRWITYMSFDGGGSDIMLVENFR